MKKSKSFALLAAVVLLGARAQAQPCVAGMAGDYPCENIDQLAMMTLSDLGGGQNINDVWGWTSPESGREYAIVGKFTGTAFVDITDPYTPILIAQVPTQTQNSLWRDVKVQGHYAYIASEAAEHGMQVFDLERLDLVHCPPELLAPDTVYTQFGSCHNLVIGKNIPYVYAVGTNTFAGGLHIVDISDPLNPTFAGSFEGDAYVHDAEVITYHGPDTEHQGQEIVMAASADNLSIMDATDKEDINLITTYTYEQLGYAHQGWVTPDHKYYLSNDEQDEEFFDINTRTLIWDISDLENPELIGTYLANSTSIDHNLYIRDGVVYESNYRSGLRILDLVDVANGNLSESGFFDVDPDSDFASFAGTWSNYPYFQSGVVPVTNMYEGLHILEPRLVKVNRKVMSGCGGTSANFTIQSAIDLNGSVDVSLSGLPGAVSADMPSTMSTPGNMNISLSWSNLEAGTYPFQVEISNSDTTLALNSKLIVENGPPSAPVLVSPLSGTILDYSFARLHWQGQAAEDYTVQIAADLSFSALIMEEDLGREEFTAKLEGGQAYYWRVKAMNDCGQSDFSQAQPFNTTCGTEVGFQNPETHEIAVYPNPTHGVVNLVNIEGFTGDYRVFDLSGRILKNGALRGKNAQINLGELSTGVYILQVGDHNMERVVVE